MIPPPPQRSVELGARPRDLADLEPSHGQEEQVEGVGLALAGRETLLQRGDGLGILARAVLGDAQRVQVDGRIGRRRDRLARQGQRLLRDRARPPGR